MSFDFVHCLQQDFKFYEIVAGADIDKETESITVNQIAGKDDITTILNLCNWGSSLRLTFNIF
jgi:hypothetical protein